MPITTASGETTWKYDLESSTETLQRVTNIEATIKHLQEELGTIRNETTTLVQDIRCDITHEHNIAKNQIDGILYNQAQSMELFAILTRSKLFRFLNFFGQWFIYTDSGYPLANTAVNEQYGKRPALTRLRVWLKKSFCKIRKWAKEWVHTIPVDREKGGH